MAFFKFRKNGDEQSAAPVQPESVEAMRRRAKYRLIGAAVLVLLGVIGFPLLFDKQPRPIPVDMPIEIPDRNKVKPLSIPAPAAMQADKSDIAASALPSTPMPAPAAVPMIEEKLVNPPVAAAPEATKIIAKTESKSADKPADKPVQAPVKADEASKAKALLEGRDAEKKVDASEGRYVVQVGAF
jgi:DedD protein